ncbi:MAG: hypothetical protein JW829_08405, partial [Pirellulales bacterium]|nr:hypothetical protein [Pirellulales bacterium]
VTRGAEGCLLVSGDQAVDVSGLSVQVVDTVGAGDAFNAAMSLGFLFELDLNSIACFSNEMGGLVASHAGAMPELDDRIAELKSQYGLML